MPELRETEERLSAATREALTAKNGSPPLQRRNPDIAPGVSNVQPVPKIPEEAEKMEQQQATQDFVRAVVEGVRVENAKEFGAMNTAIAKGFGEANTAIAKGFGEANTAIANTNTAIANINTENAERASRHLAWTLGTIITLGILATAMLGFLMRIWTEQPAPPTPQETPVAVDPPPAAPVP